MKNLLVTGGLGFIGSNLIRTALRRHPSWRVVNLDKRTYAGNPENLRELEALGLPVREAVRPEKAWTGPRYRWVRADIGDLKTACRLMAKADAVIHLAAETHVDRSILGSDAFLRTNVLGTHALLEAARRGKVRRFVHVGTDEVYGSLARGAAGENHPLAPNSPYSSSKAAADLLARSYHVTHKVPVIVTRASNNFGPYQFPEKALPLLITNAIEGRPFPLYGDGRQVRDWLYVLDHVEALLLVLKKGVPGEIYNVGGGRSLNNKALIGKVLKLMGRPWSMITPVPDRPGHDRRYALDSRKLRRLGWKPKVPFEAELAETIRWYERNASWWKPLKRAASFKSYYKRQYGARLRDGRAGMRK